MMRLEYYDIIDEKGLGKRGKPIEPKSELKDFILPKKGTFDKIFILLMLFMLGGNMSVLNYNIVKDMHETKNMSRVQIEREVQEFSNIGKTKTEEKAYGLLKHVFNTGYWGRQAYYFKNNLK